MLLSEINEANKHAELHLQVPPWPWRKDKLPVAIAAGSVVQFSTRFQHGLATVQEIDFARHYSVRLEWTNQDGHKRIENFAPTEFLSLRHA